MEQQRFDRLSRVIGTARTRRSAARLVAATFVGIAAPAALDPNGTPAADARHRKRCKAPLSACGKKCKNLQTDTENCGACGTHCQGSLSCLSGNCACRPIDYGCFSDDQCCTGVCGFYDGVGTCRNAVCFTSGSCTANAQCCRYGCIAGECF